ncbi:hypothetical protein D8674_028483 [Pyrus ussuriensis x Pyrus communis]|uniref:Uncharacterized protein n=1 Tax=Pyrus ussuriensis x Pyrus communis TaxID=2448454 RepID=A0A5N5HWD4_9ROSA|nr:hypothetical protein D8674_028483 [Pyrus ussuriensis x Pyrus communis]
MSLNCLSCQVRQRTSSSGDREHASKEKAYRKLCCVNINIDRSWSGNLTSPPYEQIENSSIFVLEKKKGKKGPGHRRLMTTGGVAYEGSTEPRLVRSSGMRRDWSFENLSLLRNEKKGRNS